jgi:hypothetical protein
LMGLPPFARSDPILKPTQAGRRPAARVGPVFSGGPHSPP